MRNICAALTAALLLMALTGCGSAPAGAAPAAGQSHNTSDGQSAAAQAASSAPELPESFVPDNSAADSVPQSDALLSDEAIRPEFQQAMDSYEAFFDEYCDFMQRYSESDGTDLNLLADYASMMEQYAQATADFSSWDSDELTTAELALYLDVQTRVNEKLLKISS